MRIMTADLTYASNGQLKNPLTALFQTFHSWPAIEPWSQLFLASLLSNIVKKAKFEGPLIMVRIRDILPVLPQS